MKHEKIINRSNGDVVKIVTLINSNVFIESGYEQEQFALVKHVGSDDWIGYHHQYNSKSMSREDYFKNHRPSTFFGVVSVGESLKAGVEAKDKFFENNKNMLT